MRKMFLLLILLLPIVLFPQQETSASTEVVAVVNGEVITMEMLNLEADLSRILKGIASVDTRFFDVLTTTQEGIMFLLRYKKEVLNDMVDQLLIQQLARKEGIDISDEEVEKIVSKRLEDTAKSLGATIEELDKFLKESGFGDIEKLKKRLKWALKTQLSLERLKEKVTASATITEEEVKSYYENNKDQFKTQSSIHALRILTKTKEDAEKALDLIRSGEDFSKVASDLSVDDLTKHTGGDMGWFTKDAPFLDEDVKKIIFNAPVGAILGPYKTSKGWEIYKIVEIKRASLIPLEKVKEDIVNILLSDKKNKMWNDWLKKSFNEFKKQSKVEILLGGGKE